MTEYLGHFAALATSVAWSFTSVFFTLSGRRVGAAIVNRTRLLLAVGLVALVHMFTQGSILPLKAEPFRWGWLAFSGLIGLVIGDSLLFQALVQIGPRLSMLLMALVPVFSALLGWLFLQENLTGIEFLGIGLTVSGVGLVIADRDNSSGSTGPTDRRRYYMGILLGLGGALGQAGGLAASKMGLRGSFPALSGNLIRLLTATIVIWIIAAIQRRARASFQALKAHPQALWATVSGAIAGPFVGVWLSLVAIQNAPLGIASTLMSLSPILLLPVGHLYFKETVGLKAIGGTFLAVAGSALLFV